MPNRFSRVALRFFLVVAALCSAVSMTAGCSDENNVAQPATQVAAIVNGDEITVHQINYVLEQNQNIPPEAAEEATRRVLERLIDQQLAVQQALENKLDRSPEVMQSIEAAKREVLARAYLKSVAKSAPQRYEWDLQNQEEINAYYAAHPELFAQRRVFTIEELNFVAKDNIAGAIRAEMTDSRSMQQIANWLKSRNIRFATKRSVRSAEQISLKHLPQIHAMKQGDIALFELGNERYQVIWLVTFEEAPIDKARATPRIAQFLSNQDATRMLKTEMKRMRDQATIEYVGEFAGVRPDAQVENESGALPE